METKHKFTPDPSLKLMDQVRQVLRYHHYAITTERAYCKWILRFIHHFGGRRHPRDMDAVEIETFLSHIASAEKVSAAIQRQAPGQSHLDSCRFSPKGHKANNEYRTTNAE